MSDEELSVRVRLASLGEAHALTQVLDEEQIPYRERPYLDTAFDGLGLAMNQQIGWGEVWVRSQDEARVSEALKEIRATPAPESTPEPVPPEEEEARGRPSFRGLWLLVAVVIGVVGAVIALSIWGGSRCERLADPAQRERCEQQLERERGKVYRQPRDWR